MRTSKKLLALLLAAMMTASLAACGSDDSGSTPAADNGTAASDNGGTAAETPTEPTEVQLPLADGESLSYFISLDANASIVVTDYNDNEFFQALEEKTGVHIEWQMSSSADTLTNFNLMIASNQLPDMFYGSQYYSEGMDAGIDDGYFLDLTDLVPEYMPNYSARLAADPQAQIDTVTDSSRIASIYALYTEPQGPWLGMQIRQDWLQKCGLDMPVTYADWEEVLTPFKDQMGATAPLSVTFNGTDTMTGGMAAGYGVIGTWQLGEDGKVMYGPYSENWKQYVTMMHDWFEKGLIDPDFMTQSAFMVDMTSVITGKTGAWISMYTMPSLYEASSEDPDMYIVPITPPVQNEGDELHIRYRDTYVGITTTLSATSDNWELSLRWLDYLFSDEGSMLANYGVEGDTYTLDDSGNPVFTDKVLANEDFSFSQAQGSFLMPPSSVACYYDWTRELASVPEKDVTSYDVWSAAGQDWTLPTLSLTQDESVDRADIMGDVDTYVQEKTTQFITGVLDIDTEWDTYMSDIASMGIDEAIAITQAAYDRYLAR